MPKPTRETVDLAAYPDLVVMYLGMRCNSLRGIRTIIAVGPQIDASVAAKPDGLLRHESIFYGFFPLHIGMRQYWRDFDSLERWAREGQHMDWWKNFAKDPGGVGFWHETYMKRGGIEAIWADVPGKVGLKAFAPITAPKGSMFSARNRVGIGGAETKANPIPDEQESIQEWVLTVWAWG